jgi:excinuclease ABC subunit A
MREIHIWGIKQNNLKNVEIRIPIGSFTVICGPSGSGKSSLAFETLFAEGQRRFIESMSNYARQFLNKAPKPDVEGVENIPPSISIEQKNSVKNSRSTVGTTTELVDYFRLLYEKVGVSHCPTHKVPTLKQSVTEATDGLIKSFQGLRGYILVEIDKDLRVQQGKKLHSLLLQDGYLRIWKNKEVLDLSSPEFIKKGLPKETFYLVIDRMAFSEDERGRIADSVNQAYEASQKYNLNLLNRFCTVVTTDGQSLKFSEEDSCPVCSYVPPRKSSRLFSFNSPVGACQTCKGFGNILDLDEQKIIPNPKLSLSEGALHPFTMPSAAQDLKQLLGYCKMAKISTTTPWEDLPKKQRDTLWNGNSDFFGVKGLFAYLEEIKYKMHVRVFISRYRTPFLCPDCKGSRLRKESLDVLIHGRSVHDFCEMTISELAVQFSKIQFSKHEQEIAHEIIKQISSRLKFLNQVGVHYLTLNRETKTLSGGEYQRLMLANQLGMGLSQTLYVLDEPTVGLHPRDNDRLISILKELKDLGNTLVIVEHDHDVIKNSEYILEMGPGSGYLGGQIVYSGLTEKFYDVADSKTVRFLKPQKIVGSPMGTSRTVDMNHHKFKLSLVGANGNNLRNLSVDIPLHRLVTVTGVSGSGKSTLITKTLYPALARALEIEYLAAAPYKEILGSEFIKNILLIDQSSIGKSARSSPVTYLKAFDAVRDIMASVNESKVRGYTPGTFSLNVDGGRCPACKGTGFEEIDMMFMDNVILPCDVCDGKKYRPEILEIKYKDKNISEILKMTVDQAMNFFVAHPPIRKPLSVLKEVGLEYLQLGQSASTLSGGESQRLKIAKELSQVNQRDTLYILDEPTTGLHFQEVQLLLRVLNKLIEAGGSVIVVEHNLDVIRQSDYIIDLGPEAGQGGGKIVACGSPQEIIKEKKSLTGQYLKKYTESMFKTSTGSSRA